MRVRSALDFGRTMGEQHRMNKPLAVTMGDPAGIGPEVLAKTLATWAGESRLLLVGARWALERGAEVAGVHLPTIADAGDDGGFDGGVGLLDVSVPRWNGYQEGTVDAEAGRLAVMSVERAAHLCSQGLVAGMVTCPIHKEAIHAAGFVDDIGHQEILARVTGAESTATMLMTPGLKVVHLSTHKSLIEAARFVTKDNVLAKLSLTQESLVRWGMSAPKIAVAALNPHGGEGGLLGSEEQAELAPAVADAVAAGIDAAGPIPADSVFNRAIAGEFDAVLALYHDQGHIAIKVHDFHNSTTATLGIPFVRTSVDHGTAFDIAGRGVADPTGLRAAIDAAATLVAGRLA